AVELIALAEQPFQVLLGHVAVPGRDVHHQLRLGRLAVRLAVAAQVLRQRLPHQPFHEGSIQGCRAHDRDLFPAAPSAALPARISRGPASSTSRRCSAVTSLSTMSVSMAANSHKNASAGRPILVWSATTTTSSAQRIICRSVSTRSGLLLNSPLAVMPAT